MKHDRAALEQLHGIVPIGGNLTEGLLGEITVGPRLLPVKQARSIGSSRFLQCPAHPQVAYLPSRKRGNPGKACDLNGRLCINGHSASPYSCRAVQASVCVACSRISSKPAMSIH